MIKGYYIAPMNLKKRVKKGQCAVSHCTRPSGSKTPLCNKHHYQQKKEKNEVRIVWQALKDNAGRRRKDFSITLDEFRKWCADNEYLEKRGRTSDSLTIDRIRQEEGYHINNIQIMTNVENSLKYRLWKSQGEPASTFHPTWQEPDSGDDWGKEQKSAVSDDEDLPF